MVVVDSYNFLPICHGNFDRKNGDSESENIRFQFWAGGFSTYVLLT